LYTLVKKQTMTKNRQKKSSQSVFKKSEPDLTAKISSQNNLHATLLP